MAESSDKQPEPGQPDQPIEFDDGASDQSMIDALMGGGGDGAAPSDTGEPAAQPVEAIDSGDMGGVQEINQADIDALMSASGSGTTDSGASMESAKEAEPTAQDERPDSPGRPFDAAAAAMQAAIEEEKAAAAAAKKAKAGTPSPPPAPAAPPPPIQPFTLSDIGVAADLRVDPKRITMLNDVNLRVRIELGRTQMLVEDVLQLDEGSVVELEKLAGDPVDVYVNDRLVAKGEVLVLNDNFCVRISEVISHDPHRVSA